MKRWIFRIGIALGLVLLVILALAFRSETDTTVIVSYTQKEGLKNVKPDWPGTPVDQKGRFTNYEFPFLIKMSSLLRWKLGANPQSDEKKNDPYRIEVKDPGDFLAGEKDGILWLGHASFYIRLGGKGIVIDPVFGDPWLLSREVPVESPIDKMKRIDYVLVSHDHRDHADAPTLERLAQKFPDARFIGGLGMEDVLSSGVNGIKTHTAGWFQQFDLTDENVKVFFVPVRHWCQRGAFDLNTRLWGGFVIQYKDTTIYFGGDSGYGRHYRETAEVFPEIDYFLIGIGAYKPRWFMEPNHNSPEDTLKAFTDSGAKTMIPMHYGTFNLSDEPPGEPIQLLDEGAIGAGVTGRIKRLAIGESIVIGN
jgi:L-ascorbate metabolism protein UlaG (beta-lactamase superfamily)